MFGFALRDMARRAGAAGCKYALMIEDDVVAAVDWEAQLRAAVAAAATRDPAWRMVKLFVPSYFNAWTARDAAFWLPVLFCFYAAALVAAEAAAAALPRRLPPCALLPPPARRRVPARERARAVAAAAALATAGAAAFFLFAGRAAAPCAANADACAGVAPLDTVEGAVFSQAQVFNVATLGAFATCLERTPRVPPRATAALPKARHDTCWQIDLAMARCLARTGAGPLDDDAGCAALPRTPTAADECAPTTAAFPGAGAYRARPSVFQHVGILDAGGGLKGLRVSYEWAARGATLAALKSLAT